MAFSPCTLVFIIKPAHNLFLLASTGVTNTHGPSSQPTSCSQTTATGSYSPMSGYYLLGIMNLIFIFLSLSICLSLFLFLRLSFCQSCLLIFGDFEHKERTHVCRQKVRLFYVVKSKYISYGDPPFYRLEGVYVQGVQCVINLGGGS